MKTLLFLLLTSIPSFVNAQNLIKSKTTDNWYVGVTWVGRLNITVIVSVITTMKNLAPHEILMITIS